MHNQFMQLAIDLALENVRQNRGGPFGAIIVKDNNIIATGANSVTATNDPTAHAEMVAIRNACLILGSFQLTGCTIYSSCEPCPMCLGAIYWARPEKLYFAASKNDAAAIDFDDAFIYQEIALPITERKLPTEQIMHQESLIAFQEWQQSQRAIKY